VLYFIGRYFWGCCGIFPFQRVLSTNTAHSIHISLFLYLFWTTRIPIWILMVCICINRCNIITMFVKIMRHYSVLLANQPAVLLSHRISTSHQSVSSTFFLTTNQHQPLATTSRTTTSQQNSSSTPSHLIKSLLLNVESLSLHNKKSCYLWKFDFKFVELG